LLTFLAGWMMFGVLAMDGPTRADSPAATSSELPYVIDLTPHYDDVFRSADGSDSAYFGFAGRKTIDGLPFDIGGNIPLYGKSAAERNDKYPEDVADIKIGRKFDELHLIHAARWREYYGCPVAVVRLHYANGLAHDFVIRDEFQVNDWSRLFTENEEMADPDTKIVWRGKGSARGTGRLFKTVLHNPYPGLKVDTMELISTQSAMSYVLVAATVAQTNPSREVTPPLSLEPSRRFDGALTLHIVDVTTGKPLAGAEINTAWVTDNISLVGDSVVTSADGVAVVNFPKDSTKDLRVQVVKDGYITCNDNWQKGWDGPSVPVKMTYQLTAGDNPGPNESASTPDNADSRIQVSDEGRLYHAVVYQQTGSATPTLVGKPYQFIADIRNTMPNSKGVVSLPAGTAWTTNPVTVVDPANLAGSHYLYAEGFGSKADLMAAFPNGDYTFKIGRTYLSGVTTSYSVPATFSGSVDMPTVAPSILRGDWKAGALVLDPSSAVVSYKKIPGVTFTWELVGGGTSAGGSSGTANGKLDLTGFLQPGCTYQAQMRFVKTDSSVTAGDPTRPPEKAPSVTLTRPWPRRSSNLPSRPRQVRARESEGGKRCNEPFVKPLS
jgi:hypothetical protein